VPKTAPVELYRSFSRRLGGNAKAAIEALHLLTDGDLESRNLTVQDLWQREPPNEADLPDDVRSFSVDGDTYFSRDAVNASSIDLNETFALVYSSVTVGAFHRNPSDINERPRLDDIGAYIVTAYQGEGFLCFRKYSSKGLRV
jgi:hypothetical protein